MESIATLVGIDVCKARLDVYIQAERGPCRYEFSNDAKGIQALLAIVPAGAVVAMEATGRYEAAVRHALQDAGFEVRVQNPRLVRRLAEGLGVKAKTDLIDAQVLARTAHLCAPNSPRSKSREALADLHRTIQAMKKERSGHLKRLGCPGFSATAAASLKRLIQALEREVATLEKAFVKAVKASEFARSYTLVLTIPGVGPALARAAVCELPEDLSGWSLRQIASYAGLARWIIPLAGRVARLGSPGTATSI